MVVIEASELRKTFRIPDRRIDSFKERAIHPFTRVGYRELHALRGVTFEVHKGQFFGIVGQNGSGKSTLLKLLASIYRADGGRIRMAGRLAPFIELGVGFDPELTASENGVINGVLMGLSKREARHRLDAVLDFAELQDFAELRLKNYSSGMMVRLAFAVMVQAEADIMLIDEVLAVGDAAFAQKCMDVFHARKEAGMTTVLVTHDMATVQSLCDRALVLDDGQVDYLGSPEEAALRYYRLNFADGAEGDGAASAVPDFNARVVEARLIDEAGHGVGTVEQGAPIMLDAVLEARRDLVAPRFLIQVANADGVLVFGLERAIDEGERPVVGEGERVRLSGRIENVLVPGRYSVGCWVRRDRRGGDMAVQGLHLLDFVVYGPNAGDGVVSVDADVRAVREP
jgi:ABC-2 type transport system ATP-binding protein